MILGSAALVVAALLQRPWTARRAAVRRRPAARLRGARRASPRCRSCGRWRPSDSWIEANRTFAYLAAVRRRHRVRPARAAALAGAAARASRLGCLLVCGWALLTKVFPASLAPEETYARLREPFAYWNSVGLMAALGVPPMLWLAARRSGHAAVNALAWPAIGLLLVCMMLSYSRGALRRARARHRRVVPARAAAPARAGRAGRRRRGRRPARSRGRSRRTA